MHALMLLFFVWFDMLVLEEVQRADAKEPVLLFSQNMDSSIENIVAIHV